MIIIELIDMLIDAIDDAVDYAEKCIWSLVGICHNHEWHLADDIFVIDTDATMVEIDHWYVCRKCGQGTGTPT